MEASNIMYEALKSQFEAQRQLALAQLTIYLTNPVGVGVNSNHIEKMIEMTRSLAEANECISTLTATFQNNQNNKNSDKNDSK